MFPFRDSSSPSLPPTPAFLAGHIFAGFVLLCPSVGLGLDKCLHAWKLPDGAEVEHLVSVKILFSGY